MARHQTRLKQRSIDTHVHTSTGGRMGCFRAQHPQRAKWREAGHTGRRRGSGPVPCLAGPGQALPDPPHSCTFHLNSPWTILPPPPPRAPPGTPPPNTLGLVWPPFSPFVGAFSLGMCGCCRQMNNGPAQEPHPPTPTHVGRDRASAGRPGCHAGEEGAGDTPGLPGAVTTEKPGSGNEQLPR